MTTRYLDSRLLALITAAFSLLAAGALWTDLAQVPDAHIVASQA